MVFDASVLETEDQVQAARDQQCEHREQQKAKPSRHPQQRMRCTDIHRYTNVFVVTPIFPCLNPSTQLRVSFSTKLLQTNLQHPIHDCKSVSRETHLAEHQHGHCSLTQKRREILQELTKMKWGSGGRGGGGGGDDHGVMMTQKS